MNESFYCRYTTKSIRQFTVRPHFIFTVRLIPCSFAIAIVYLYATTTNRSKRSSPAFKARVSQPKPYYHRLKYSAVLLNRVDINLLTHFLRIMINNEYIFCTILLNRDIFYTSLGLECYLLIYIYIWWWYMFRCQVKNEIRTASSSSSTDYAMGNRHMVWWRKEGGWRTDPVQFNNKQQWEE